MATANMESSAALAAGRRTASCFDLVRDHQAEIWRYLRYLGCENGQAEDLAQETFLAILRKPPADLGPTAARAYLRTIARNLFIMALRKHRRAAPTFDLEMAEEVWAETHVQDGGDAYLEALDECLGQLEGRAKTAIELAYRENRSRGEMAAALDMSEDGVKSLLRRTRDVLRQCIERKVR